MITEKPRGGAFAKRASTSVANTRYLREAVEAWVRDRLEQEHGQPFSAKVVRLSPGGSREFDAISKDGSIVCSIKANSGLTSGRKHPTGKVATCLNEVYFLTIVSAPTRKLVLTNPSFYEIFCRTTAGQIAPGVEVVLLPLPAAMQAEVDRVTKQASDEMTRQAVVEAVAVAVEEEAEKST